LGSAASIKPETITEVASRATEPLLKNLSSRRARAAPGGVSGAGVLPERTGVKPFEARLATVAPSTAEASVLNGRAAEQQILGACQSRRPQLRVLPHPPEPPAEQRREYSRQVHRLKARPRLVQDASALALSEMLLTVGLSETCPKSVPPNQPRCLGCGPLCRTWRLLSWTVPSFRLSSLSVTAPTSRGSIPLLIRRGQPLNRTSKSSACYRSMRS
jgi:hypothetical protein